jgi:quercetin dioxygenase-like cupin family protein
MKAFHYTEVPAQPAAVPGVALRWVIGQNMGAPNFAMRVIEIQPGAATEHHAHAWEHEVFVVEGKGIACDKQRETPIAPGSCIYVEPNEIHHFANVGDTVMRIICVIPNPPKS